MQKAIVDHKWQCKCGAWVGEDYEECPLCQQKKLTEKEKQGEEKIKYQIKNKCASCGKEFQNDEKKFREKGNLCFNCNLKCEAKLKWRKIKKAKQWWEELLQRAELAGGEIANKNKKVFKRSEIQKEIKDKEKKLEKLTRQIMKKWGIDMEEENEEFQKFENYIKKAFSVKD